MGSWILGPGILGLESLVVSPRSWDPGVSGLLSRVLGDVVLGDVVLGFQVLTLDYANQIGRFVILH